MLHCYFQAFESLRVFIYVFIIVPVQNIPGSNLDGVLTEFEHSCNGRVV